VRTWARVNWSDLAVSGLLPKGTVTLLLADVAGSTRLRETQLDEVTVAVANLDRAVSNAIAADGGQDADNPEGRQLGHSTAWSEPGWPWMPSPCGRRVGVHAGTNYEVGRTTRKRVGR
jgi:hypothetical protein